MGITAAHNLIQLILLYVVPIVKYIMFSIILTNHRSKNFHKYDFVFAIMSKRHRIGQADKFKRTVRVCVKHHTAVDERHSTSKYDASIVVL